MENAKNYTAFCGSRRIVSAGLAEVLTATKRYLDEGGVDRVLIFDDATGAQVEFDFQGSLGQVLARVPEAHVEPPASDLAPPGVARPGRPKLGVVSREVSLLPRHWEWLERQPSGASAALRRLVELAEKSGRSAERARAALEATAKFMWNMAGDLPHFEEASRALYAKDWSRLQERVLSWPDDIRAHVEQLAARAQSLHEAAASERAD